jgi:N-acetylmuramoyl-L-alanine amidase
MSDPIRQGSAGYPVHEVILHCAAIKTGFFDGKTAAYVRAEIDRWHKARGFSGIGYHGLFMPDGEFIQGRPYTQVGAHVLERNRGTIGFLMIESREITRMGDFGDWFTQEQRRAVRGRIRTLPGIKWVTGHNDYANKLCPGFKVQDGDWL